MDELQTMVGEVVDERSMSKVDSLNNLKMPGH